MHYVFIGLSTIFAWTPANILLLFACFALYSAIVNIAVVPLSLTLELIFVGVGGILGYVGISAICWDLKLSDKQQLVCLSSGVLALGFTLWKGEVSNNKLLQLGSDWVDWYLFVSPLIFTLLHIVLLFISIKRRP
jgi:hypothetical protein